MEHISPRVNEYSICRGDEVVEKVFEGPIKLEILTISGISTVFTPSLFLTSRSLCCLESLLIMLVVLHCPEFVDTEATPKREAAFYSSKREASRLKPTIIVVRSKTEEGARNRASYYIIAWSQNHG